MDFVKKLMQSLEGKPTPKVEAEVKGLSFPFVPSKEYMCPNTGVFYTIGKVQVVHMLAASKYDGMEAMMMLIKLCVRADGAEFSEKDLFEMEFITYKKLSDLLMSQT